MPYFCLCASDLAILISVFSKHTKLRSINSVLDVMSLCDIVWDTRVYPYGDGAYRQPSI